jgi:catechol 2,3-dioxygenase-like lactoylglutathione lyase family enzyme
VTEAARFWVEVLGFEPRNDDPEFRLVFHREARLAVVVTDHAGTVQDRFDEHHPGLDHLALAVADLDDLERWRARLDEHGVPHSGWSRATAAGTSTCGPRATSRSSCS